VIVPTEFETIVGDEFETIVPAIVPAIVPTIDGEEVKQYCISGPSHLYLKNKYQEDTLPKFYPNITSIPYSFPPYPAPSNLYKQNNTIVTPNIVTPNIEKPKPKPKSKLSFWGNAFMDTKMMRSTRKKTTPTPLPPKLQYAPYVLSSEIALKYKKD
jgi:hypothetical protein